MVMLSPGMLTGGSSCDKVLSDLEDELVLCSCTLTLLPEIRTCG